MKWCSKALTWGYTDEDMGIVRLLLKIMYLASYQTPIHTRGATSHHRQFSSSAGEEPVLERAHTTCSTNM
jgi:hypothetical protein